MKRKDFSHPCIYLSILNKNNNLIIVEFKDNEFDDKGNRVIKQRQIELPESFDKLYDDFNQILNKLNSQELIKTNNYLKIQNKVLGHHIRKNNYESVQVVKDSIKLVQSFKKELLDYEF
tara:strand:- start:589 stop:945 length:357 start_codon:yes stop_codon:yes gene_type:complete